MAASFAFSQADLEEQVLIKKASPIFKIGTVYQQHAAATKAAHGEKSTESDFSASHGDVPDCTTTDAKTFKCPEGQPVTAYKSNPTGLTTKNMGG